jgi:hypothetical protein
MPAASAGERHPSLAPFAAYLDDPTVTDLFVNGAAGLFVDRGAGAVAAREWRATEEEVRDLAVSLIGHGGRHIDDAAPCVDVRLDGGIRVHAVLPPVAPEGTAISIRVPRMTEPSLDDLRRAGMFDDTMRRTLADAIAGRANLLVSGAAGAGKTTLLAALLGEAPDHERIVTIEDVAELRIAHPHHVRLEARQPNLEGAGGIGLAPIGSSSASAAATRCGNCCRHSTPDTTAARAPCTRTGCTTSRRASRRSARSPGSTIAPSPGRWPAPSTWCCTSSAGRTASAASRRSAARPSTTTAGSPWSRWTAEGRDVRPTVAAGRTRQGGEGA